MRLAIAILPMTAGVALMLAGCGLGGDPNVPNSAARSKMQAVAALQGDARCTDQVFADVRALHETYPADDSVFMLANETFTTCQVWDELAASYERRPETVITVAERGQLSRIYLRHLSRFDDALALAEVLVAERPEDIDARSVAASSLYYLDRLDEIDAYVDPQWERFVEAGRTEIMVMRAEAAAAEEDGPRARRIYDQALEMAPNYPFVLNSFGRWLVRQDAEEDIALGERLLRRAESINTEQDRQVAETTRINNLSREMNLAWVGQNFDEVLRLALELQKLVPPEQQPEIHRTLGTVYNQLGEATQSRLAFERAAELEAELAANTQGGVAP
jgi:tetratricopeptide (TPR) repeat protein